MAICSCMLPLVNPKACEQCPNRTEPFDFIPPSNYIDKADSVYPPSTSQKELLNDNTK
jgi:hypothetical protein